MPFLPARPLVILTLLYLLVCVSLVQAAPLDPAMIPSDTKWLLHFDVEKARDWNLMQKWQQQMEGKEWYRDKVAEMVEAYGWNPAKDLKGVSMYDNEYARFNGVLALHVRNIDAEKIAFIQSFLLSLILMICRLRRVSFFILYFSLYKYDQQFDISYLDDIKPYC